jgi:WhiB family redox-sensing transcriptional regulator
MRAAPPTPSRREPDWRDASACRREDPDLFAPDGTTGKWVPIIAQAKAICNRCPVRPTCLQWALDTRQESGIWGGLTEDERWRIKVFLLFQARITYISAQIKPSGSKFHSVGINHFIGMQIFVANSNDFTILD